MSKTRIAAPLLATTLLLAACGGGGGGGGGSAQPAGTGGPGVATQSAEPSAAPSTSPTHRGGPPTTKDAKFPEISAGKNFGQDPTITFSGLPPADIMFKVLSEGSGPEVQVGDAIVADFRGQIWQEENLEVPPFENTFTTDPIVKLIGKNQIIPAWDLKIPGVKVGSRVMLVAPPSAAFGPAGKEDAGILGIDTLAFVIDIIDALDPRKVPDGAKVTPPAGLPAVEGDYDPKVVPPKKTAPKELVAQLLVKGKGPAVKTDQTLAVNYRGVIWKDGKQFDASWGRPTGPAPLGFHLGAEGIIKGWNEGLRGKPVGSRVLLVVPPDFGYGSKGLSAVGIGPNDTLVFVVDILGAY